MAFGKDSNLDKIEPFANKIWLSSPTMHGPELTYMAEAYDTNWMSTIGKNISEIEHLVAEYIGVKYAVALSTGTASLHLATRLAGERIYGRSKQNSGTLRGNKVFASDTTFAASVNPIAYENGEAVFIDAEYDTWNMDPVALEKAFELFPETKLVIIAHLYGTPGKIDELKAICERHKAYIIEDAAESLGARYLLNGKWTETGALGDFNCISFNGNKIITGSSGGMFLTDSKEDADSIRKWSTQSREDAPWYQHEEIGYNYRMSNVIAGVIRGQLPYLQEHIDKKRTIYERYKEGLEGLPIKMNPYDGEKSTPNFWLSCMTIDESAMCQQILDEKNSSYTSEEGKTCPIEILKALAMFNIEGRPIWKPMHAQPVYHKYAFVTSSGAFNRQNSVSSNTSRIDVGMDIFRRGLCLPSDIKITQEQQETIIEIIRRCFR